MMSKMTLNLGGLKKTARLFALGLVLLLAAGPAFATAVTINCNAANGNLIYNHLGSPNKIALNTFYQVIQSTDGTANPPAADGSPTGDDTLANQGPTGQISPAGEINGKNCDITAGKYVYVRVWEGATSVDELSQATHRGQSTPQSVGNGFVMPGGYKPASFSTNTSLAGTITLTNPNGGNNLKGGQSYNITWSSNDFSGNVKIEYSTNGGSDWSNVIASASNNGTHSWAVPSVNSTQCRVRISDALDNDPTDTSNTNFTIDSTKPTVTVNTPNGGETLTKGQAYNITWTASDAGGSGLKTNPIKIEYSTNGGSNYFAITSATANNGTYPWNPGVTTTQGRIRITATDNSENSNSDTSNTNFTIAEPEPDAPVISSITWKEDNEDNIKNKNSVYGTIEIKGSNFDDDPGEGSRSNQNFNVTIDGITLSEDIDVAGKPGSQIYYWDKTTVVCGVPVKGKGDNSYIKAGNNLIVAVTANGKSSNTDKTIKVKPKVYDVSPSSGLAESTVTIAGTAFGNDKDAIDISFGSKTTKPTEAKYAANPDGSIKNWVGAAVPLDAAVGDNQVTVTLNGVTSSLLYDYDRDENGKLDDQVIFTVTEAAQPALVSIDPVNAMQGETLDVTITGENTDWDGDMQSSVHFSGEGITVNSAAGDGATISANISIALDAAANERVVTVDEADGSLAFTVIEAPAESPEISSVAPSTAEIGQTVVISGSKFGDTLGEVRFDGFQAYPTVWGETSITVAVPSGVSTGEIKVSVVLPNDEDADSAITIAGENIYLDDFEGGCVGDWEYNKNSGYYEFDKYDAVYNPDKKTTSYPDREIEKSMVQDGTQAMKLLYSYGSRKDDPNYAGEDKDWGGGWGAALANTLDLSGIKGISLYIKWDGSENEITLTLKDKGQVEASATISNATLMLNTQGYGKVTVAKANFSGEGFDWENVTNYNLACKTDKESAVNHYVDNIIAYFTEEKAEEPQTEVKITSTNPYAAPAGTIMIVNGEGFGGTQGQGMLIFENNQTKASYQAEINTWSDTTIEAVVPRLAKAGTYTIKVIKVAIVAGTINAQESNPSSFKVTANAAMEGGNAVLYPNPFNPAAEGDGAEAQAMKAMTIAFNPGTATNIGVYIYDMTARLVYHEVTTASQTTWDGLDRYGALVGDGAFILRIVDEDSKRMIAKGKILVIKK